MTIYLHFDGEAVTRGQDGIARWEGEGPITLAQVRVHFGPHCQLTIKPVIDLAGQVPVHAYEVGDHRREAVHLRTPCDNWPWADNRSRGQDLDHNELSGIFIWRTPLGDYLLEDHTGTRRI